MKWLCLLGMLLSPLAAAPNRVALVTGASRGVGLATAEYFAERGYSVYGTIRPGGQGPVSISSHLHFLPVDLLSEASIQSAVEAILSKEGRIDLLINNAGYALVGPVELLTKEEMLDQMEINFFGPIRLIQAVLPAMRGQKAGHIINISSTNAVATPAFGSLYAASKSALESLSESLALEVAPFDIAVSIVEPGLLTTNFSILTGSKDLPGNPYQAVTDAIEQSLEGRPALAALSQPPEDVARILFEIAQEGCPKLRYQTSEEAAQEIAHHLLNRVRAAVHIPLHREEP